MPCLRRRGVLWRTSYIVTVESCVRFPVSTVWPLLCYNRGQVVYHILVLLSPSSSPVFQTGKITAGCAVYITLGYTDTLSDVSPHPQTCIADL